MNYEQPAKTGLIIDTGGRKTKRADALSGAGLDMDESAWSCAA